MHTLVLDTATERGVVALCQDRSVLYEIHLPFGLNNSKALFVELDNLFKKTELSKSSLELIICGQGPGSYTGMRVASAAAQSLSFALQVPLIGVPTTLGLTPTIDGPFGAIIDAKVSGVYLQKGERSKGQVRFTTQPSIVSLKELPAILQGVRTLVTPNKEFLQPKIEAIFEEVLLWEEKSLSVDQLLFAALERFSQKDFSQEQNLDLLYLRKTQAEIEKSGHVF
ncbi:Uncharacterized protein PHSC3_000998 [Chlamydiales bacterium STE3]|nr:Uncharacterized protein PHSC3_000998 [Chlamydiales bacterium STE3]